MTLPQHDLDRVLHAQKHAAHVDGVQPIEVVGGRLLDRADVGDAGVVDEDVEATELAVQIVKRAPHVIGRRHVAAPGDRVAARRADGVRRRLRGLVDVEDDRPSPLTSEQRGDRRADSRAGAGHHGDLAMQIEHGGREISHTLPVKSKDRVKKITSWLMADG